jgi:phosphate transport system ATP-binding protein
MDVTMVRKKIGLLAQKPFPLPMSIFENVAYGPRVHGERNEDRLDTIVGRMLRSVGLWDEVKDRLDEPATSLSIGQQQRLCLARGLAVEPEVVLCDEPTSALDPVSAKRVEGVLLDLKERYTIVLVTHTLRQARRMADHVMFMYDGRIEEQGPSGELFSRQRSPHARSFILGEIG